MDEGDRVWRSLFVMDPSRGELGARLLIEVNADERHLRRSQRERAPAPHLADPRVHLKIGREVDADSCVFAGRRGHGVVLREFDSELVGHRLGCW